MSTIRHAYEHGMVLRERLAEDPRGVLLLVHGLGESGLCFERLLAEPALARWHLLAPDLPGYGRSPWPAAPPAGLASHADHLAGWLRARGAPPVVVLGHSMGGVVGLLLCERHPRLVRALLDVEGNKSDGDCAFSGPAARQPLSDFLGCGGGGGFDILRAAVHAAGVSDEAQRGYHVSLRLACPRTFHRDGRDLVALSRTEELAARLAALPQPHRYVAGVPGGAAARSLELLATAGVPVDRVEPAGHWPFLDRPAEFTAALLAFLDALPA
jgi:pimeloyl-ACP methyl ester carboxylesterase